MQLERGYVRAPNGVITTRAGIVVWLGDTVEAELDALDADAPWYAGPARSPVRRRAVTPRTRRAVFDRDGGRCALCRCVVRDEKRDRFDAAPDLAEIDHIVPVCEGGSSDQANLRLLCLTCNRRRPRRTAGG